MRAAGSRVLDRAPTDVTEKVGAASKRIAAERDFSLVPLLIDRLQERVDVFEFRFGGEGGV